VESHVAASEASSGHGSSLGMPGPGGGGHHVEQELARLGEEMARLEANMDAVRDNMLTVTDRVRDVPVLKDSVRVSSWAMKGL